MPHGVPSVNRLSKAADLLVARQASRASGLGQKKVSAGATEASGSLGSDTDSKGVFYITPRPLKGRRRRFDPVSGHHLESIIYSSSITCLQFGRHSRFCLNTMF
jgi:hypothetical protein